MANRNNCSCDCNGEIKFLKRKQKFHESEIMKLKQELFEMQNTLKDLKATNISPAKKQHSKSMNPREELAQTLGGKGGAGHYYENDQSTKYGGARDNMTYSDLEKIVKLISLGQKKVNFKFDCSQSVNFDGYGWCVIYDHEHVKYHNYYDNPHEKIGQNLTLQGRFYLRKKGGGPKFEIVAERIDSKSGEIVWERDIESVTVDQKPCVDLESAIGKLSDFSKYSVRLNVTIK